MALAVARALVRAHHCEVGSSSNCSTSSTGSGEGGLVEPWKISEAGGRDLAGGSSSDCGSSSV